MKISRKIWLLMAVAVLIAVVVLLLVVLPPASGPGGTPTVTPTPSPTPVVWPTPTATGIGYPTPTATGVGYPTPTQTPCVRSLTVNQADSCCDVKVMRNETIHYDVLYGHQMRFINIPCGEVILVNASFNGSCNTWNGWIGNVDNASVINTTVTMDSDKTITASCVAEATPTATGIGYPTLTPTASPTATGIGSPTPTPTPTETAFIFWNQSSITVSNGSNFSVAVNVANIEFIVAGQFDVVYDNSSLNIAKRPAGGVIYDVYRGCGNISVSNIGNAPGVGDYKNSGLFRVLLECGWAQDSQDPCDGGAGTGPCGDGYLATFTFKGMKPGTSEIAFTGKTQVHQIVDWVPYEDYSYSGVDVVWGPNVRVTVKP